MESVGRVLVLAGVAVVVAGQRATAQGLEPLLGEWSVEYARSTRTESDGTLTVLEWGDAMLEISVDAEGMLVGVWTDTTRAGSVIEAVYRGTGTGAGFELSLDWRATGASPTERVRSQHLTGRLEDGGLSGSTWVVGTAARSGVRMPWKGRRRQFDGQATGSKETAYSRTW